MNTDLLCRYLFLMDWLFLVSFAVVVPLAGILVLCEDLVPIPNSSRAPANSSTRN